MTPCRHPSERVDATPFFHFTHPHDVEQATPMNTPLDPPAPSVPASRLPRFYAVAWRWHFYAGLYVVPFLLMLALTGLVMVFFTGFQDRLG